MRKAAAIFTAGAFAVAGCSRARSVSDRPARHLVLVTIDTLRADRLGCYGAKEVATPNLDRLAREGTMAQQATVHVPLTRPSHVSLLTGLLPSEHDIRDNVSPALDPRIPTLAETLRAQGFRTGAFVSSIVLSAQSGLGRGFEVYGDRFEAGGDDARFLNTLQKRGDRTLQEALSWLEAQRGERLFLWLHLYDPHDPYEPPEPYASRYAGRAYDGEVAWSDELVGRLDAALARLGLTQDTLLLVTSDHGEGLGDHGEAGHGFFVYQTTLAVPLLVRGPGVSAGGRLAVTARSVDVVPTLLELLGLPVAAGPGRSGRSLAQALRGRETPVEAASYAESLTPLLHFGWSDLRVLREGRWKYIQAPRPELYDLQTDPGELRDVSLAQPARAAALRTALGRMLEAERAGSAHESGAAGVPADLLEKLGALGYLGTGAPAHSSSPGADPKDKIGEFKVANRLVREGLVLLREGRPADSAARFRELLAQGIESFEVHYYLARALFTLGRHREAAGHFESSVRFQPAYGAAYRSLAECRAALGDVRAAIAAVRRGRDAAPRDASLPQAEASYWLRLKDRKQALAAYEAALPLAPKDALLRIRMGELFRDEGQLDRAASLMREGVALDGSQASYWNALGMVLGAASDLGEAERAFREAVQRDGANAQYAYNLGLALQRQGRRSEAEPYFRKALELEPRFGAARQRLRETGPGR
jgi:arylsulfatase A-like enzyme/Tfp pilus assembly protein PilF